MSKGHYPAVSSPSIHANTCSPSCHSQARCDLLHWPHTGFSSPHFILRFRHVMHPVRVRLNGPRLLSLSTLKAAFVMVDRLSTSSGCGRSSELLKGRRSSEAGRLFRKCELRRLHKRIGFHFRAVVLTFERSPCLSEQWASKHGPNSTSYGVRPRNV